MILADLHEYLSSILIAPKLIEDLCDGDIDSTYITKTQELARILKNASSEETIDSRVLRDIKPELERLRLKVCSRIRNFLMVKLN